MTEPADRSATPTWAYVAAYALIVGMFLWQWWGWGELPIAVLCNALALAGFFIFRRLFQVDSQTGRITRRR